MTDLDYICIGGPSHGQRWSYDTPYLKQYVAKPLPPSFKFEPDVACATAVDNTFTYRRMHFGHHVVWVPVDVEDPYRLVLELALKAPKSRPESE